ncbi:TetR/AcrR family transcriptional regulator [Rhodococcus maanshanensis]|uniref:Regulatory protein, tetR family n=1 Tax=Rhodococcus maanshanensis TaxID=183556 RepID=A0A1H7P249_9NOCA|nr:TetR/AcrR family transcriptional regulator [Rhodococcus maanshanensis]SEL29881.1 regulatory protein, tetR family [Rhodococcus maanshanensis]
MAAEGVAAPRKKGRPTDAERAQRRDDILDAAVGLFVARGFAQVTLDDIVAEAHVTKRTIYGYFGDRTEVFLAAVERLRLRALRRPSSGQDLEELATEIVFALHSDEAIGLHRLMITEAHRFPDLATRFYRDGPQAYIAALNGRLPEPDLELAQSVFALLLGEPHRQRLLGLRAGPDPTEAAAHAAAALRRLGLAPAQGT